MAKGNTATNVSTGKPKVSGAVWRAPLGTDIPTNATSELPEAFVCLGYVSEDGLDNENTLEMSQVKAWGGVTVYRSLTDAPDDFKLALIESENADVLKTVYGSAHVSEITVGEGEDSHTELAIDVVAGDPEEAIFVFEIALRGGKVKRIVIADGAVTAREAITYNDEDPIAYGVTISAYPDANGSTHKEYIA